MSSSFPRFPRPPSSNDRQAFEQFLDYGSVSAVDISSHDGEISVHQQKNHYSSDVALCASQPSLPALPPNPVADESMDRCMCKLNKERQALHRAIKLLRRHTGTAKVQKCQQYLAYLESVGNGSVSSEQHPPPLPFPSILSLAKELDGKIGTVTDIPLVNSAYTGGCIKHLKLPNDPNRGLVAYPTGDSMQTLALSEVSWQGSDRLHWSCKPHSVPLQDTILQLDMKHTGHGKTYCALRHAKKCRLVQLTTPEVTAGDCEVVQTRTWDDGDSPSSICLSPYLPGECVIATYKGNVSYWSADGRYELICDRLQPRFPCFDAWMCHYGSHPRQLVVSDRTGIALYDCRRPGAAVPDLFALPNNLLHQKERLMVTCALDGRHFYHLAGTDHHLILLDERFPSYPVLTWRHLLASPPQYLAPSIGVATIGSGVDDVILMASQRSRETMCFQFRVSESSRPPQSTFTPWRISQVEDFLHLATAEGIVYDKSYHLPRLSVSLLGVCGVPGVHGFTALQMTAHGDVFEQTYRVTADPSRDRTCGAGPGSECISLTADSRVVCETWLQQHKSLDHRQSVTGKPVVCESKQLDITAFLSDISRNTYPHVLCALCMPVTSSEPLDEQMSTENRDAGLTHCSACNIHLDYGRKQRDAVTKGLVIPSKMDEALQLDDCLQGIDVADYTDSLSQFLLKLWHDDDTDVELLVSKLQEERKHSLEQRLQLERSMCKVEPSQGDGSTSDDKDESTVTPDSPNSFLSPPHDNETECPQLPLVTNMDVTAPSPQQQTPSKRQRLMSPSSVCSSVHADSPGFGVTPRRLKIGSSAKTFTPSDRPLWLNTRLTDNRPATTTISTSCKKKKKIVMGF